MKNLLRISVIAIMLFSTSCDKEDNDPVEAVTYTLTVKNNSKLDADVYMKSDLPNATFKNEGTVESKGSMEVHKLVMDNKYIIRVVEVGKSVDDYFNEQTVQNKNPDKFDVTITIVNQD